MLEKIKEDTLAERVAISREKHAAEQAAAEKEAAARAIMDQIFDRLTPGLEKLTDEAAARVNLIAVLDLFSVSITPKKNLSVMIEITGRELVRPEKLRMLQPFSREDLLYHAEVLEELIAKIGNKFPSAKFETADLKDFIRGNRPRP